MSFDFVPRSVKRRKTAVTLTFPEKSARESLAHKVSEAHVANTASSKECSSQTSALKASTSNKDPDLQILADLVCLAMSDYALWADVDLRRKIDWSANLQQQDEGNDEGVKDSPNDVAGYIPLTFLLRHSPIFIQASSLPSFSQCPETIYVKALRIHATESVDVRLVLSSEANGSRNPTGYEVRRKISVVVDGSDLSQYGKSNWDGLTIYVENIPTQYRHISETLKFITSLLQPAPPPHIPIRIQSIIYPRHHRDQPTSVSVCKGFALVILTSQRDVNYILEKWPWDNIPADSGSKAKYELPGLQDAAKFGFRSISKERWESLKAEYLLFRQQLVQEINESQEKEQVPRRRVEAPVPPPKPIPSVPSKNSHDPSFAKRSDAHAESHTGSTTIHANSSYPSGCLVFVRHLHPDTNKTTLRTLFTQAWSSEEGTSSTAQPVGGIDYLDYMKGMDSCHIRLSTPSHAKQFVSYFATHEKQQTSGLDGVGSPSEAADVIICAEFVLGKREEVYWEKVPEKVRRQAVDKALKLINSGDGDNDSQQGRPSDNGHGGGRKKRKR